MYLLRLLLRTQITSCLPCSRGYDRPGLVDYNIDVNSNLYCPSTYTGAAYIVLNPEYAKPTHRGARTQVFIGLGLSAVFPVSHLLISHGSEKLFAEMGFGWLLASGGLYIGGALL